MYFLYLISYCHREEKSGRLRREGTRRADKRIQIKPRTRKRVPGRGTHKHTHTHTQQHKHTHPHTQQTHTHTTPRPAPRREGAPRTLAPSRHDRDTHTHTHTGGGRRLEGRDGAVPGDKTPPPEPDEIRMGSPGGPGSHTFQPPANLFHKVEPTCRTWGQNRETQGIT